MSTIATVPDVPNNYDATNGKKIMIHDLSQPAGSQTKKFDAGALPYHRKDQTIQHKDHLEVTNAASNGFIRWFVRRIVSGQLFIDLLNLAFVDSKQGRFSQSLEIGNGGAPQGEINLWGDNAEAYTSLKAQADVPAANTVLLPNFNCNLGEREELYKYEYDGDIIVPNTARTAFILNLPEARPIFLPTTNIYEGKKIDIIHISEAGEIPNYSTSVSPIIGGGFVTTVPINRAHKLIFLNGGWKLLESFVY